MDEPKFDLRDIAKQQIRVAVVEPIDLKILHTSWQFQMGVKSNRGAIADQLNSYLDSFDKKAPIARRDIDRLQHFRCGARSNVAGVELNEAAL